MEKIAKRIANNEFDQAAQLAHKLKGQAGNLAATALYEAAGALEQAINQRLPNQNEKFSVLAQEHTRLFKALDVYKSK